MIEERYLQEIVNPVFNTAKSCLQLDAASGDGDSQLLLDTLGFGAFGKNLTGNSTIPPQLLDQVKRLAPAYVVIIESRFKSMNRFIESRSGSQVAYNKDLLSLYNAITNKAAKNASDATLYQNVFFDDDESKAEDFVRRMGFRLTKLSMADYLPESFGAIKDVPEVEADLRSVFKNMYFWELSPEGRSRTVDRTCESASEFSAKAELKEGALSFSLEGRIDTLTAPGLLRLYEDKISEAGGKIDSITLDFARLSYISSAGLRVLMIMYKALKNKSVFYGLNISPELQSIFSTTGFDIMFADK